MVATSKWVDLYASASPLASSLQFLRASSISLVLLDKTRKPFVYLYLAGQILRNSLPRDLQKTTRTSGGQTGTAPTFTEAEKIEVIRHLPKVDVSMATRDKMSPSLSTRLRSAIDFGFHSVKDRRGAPFHCAGDIQAADDLLKALTREFGLNDVSDTINPALFKTAKGRSD